MNHILGEINSDALKKGSTRVAVISDIHGNGYALQKVLGDIKKRKIDQYFFLGDYITDGPNVNSILNTVRELGDVVLAGNREEYMIDYQLNHDERWANSLQFQSYYYTYNRLKPDNLQYISGLPIMQQVHIDGVSILLYHGIPTKARKVFVPMRDLDVAQQFINDYKADVYIGGHTHVAYAYELDGRLFVNPGSVGLPIRSKGINYGILQILHGLVHWEQITIPYDHQEMVTSLTTSKALYLKSSGIWPELYFQSLQANRDMVYDFLTIAYGLANIETKMGETKDIDNETFKEAIKIYKQKKTQ